MNAAPARREFPWGPLHVLLGVGAATAALLASNVVLIVLVLSTDREFIIEDIGGVFEKANAIGEYAVERLAAATNGEALPEAPPLLADLQLVKAAIAVTIVYQVALVMIVILVSRKPASELVRLLKLDRFDRETIWKPVVVAVGCYILIGVYSVIAAAIGPDFLEPKSTVPREILRDDAAIAITGVAAVIGAPISEELFFRGLIFGGLLRWGFAPAALVSGLLFAGVHFDPGSIIPFTLIGVTLAWLFWHRGHLWDAIVFHVFFNSASFILLVSLER